MRRVLLLPLLALGILGCSGKQAEAPAAPSSLAEAQAMARERNVPLFVDFFSPT